MDSDKKYETLKKVKNYSEIIADKRLLEKSWKSYIDFQAKQYIEYWSPILLPPWKTTAFGGGDVLTGYAVR